MATPVQIGRYEILEELGHGAMGSVYKARDPLMDRTVAVKTVLASALAGASAAEYRERFFREARAAGRFNHPGIVTVHDVGEHEGSPFLVMEYITGRTLAASMEAGERFSFERIYELGREIAEALGYAHAHGVIHRDIKPANIMLAAAPRGGERAKVTDFGVAKLTAAQVTVTGQLLGTPSFMPPEQFTGAPIDGRSDLFSLGVILYWMATGDKPFTGDTITAVSYKIVHTEIVPPRKINPAIPRDFELVILKLLQKDPAQRYATGEALAEDLAALRAGRTPAAAEATAITGPSAVARTSREHDPDATLDIDAAPPSRPAAQRHATQSRVVQAETPPAAPAHASTVVQPASHSGRWQTLLLAVLVVAVLYLVWRQGASQPPVVQAPTVETSPQQPADTAPKEPSTPTDAQSAAKRPDSKPSSKEGEGNRILAGKSPVNPDPQQPPKPAAIPGMPDTEKLNRDVQAFVAQAMKDAANAQNFAKSQQRGIQIKRLRDEPPPAGKARLIIDASRISPSLRFALEVDGAIVFQHTPGAEATPTGPQVYSHFVDAGSHRIRVLAGPEESRPLSSNLVAGNFAASGHRLLILQNRFEVRPRRSAADNEQASARTALLISLQ